MTQALEGEGGFVTVEITPDTERWQDKIDWTKTILEILGAERREATE